MEERAGAHPETSIVVPTKDGGERLEGCLERVFAQRAPFFFEVVVVDSGSAEDSLARIRRFPVRLHAIPPEEFNHGRTRDLGASLARGRHLVFLNQDAVPASEEWLARLVGPLREGSEFAAVQGGIREFEEGPRFFWDSAGPRFYFTRESRRWIARHGGLGFSTVNAAIRRSAWEACPFGEAVTMEDKKWQRAALERGLRIAQRPEASVFHTHVYDLRGLARRCQQEGFGWRLLGETYSVLDLALDTLSPGKFVELAKGAVSGRSLTLAEWLFPFVRPWLVFRGNRRIRKYPA
jgi:rhamnosyltransferase